jgi:hypothetical protein
VLAKVVIDSTGDGDLLPYAGAEFDSTIGRTLRISNLAQVFWLVNVDTRRLDEFKTSQPQKYVELMQQLTNLGGFTNYFKDLLEDHDGVLWFHPHIPCDDQADVEQMTSVDVSTRKRVTTTYDFLKKHVPGFEKSYIMLTAPQLGTTGGRRLIGEYVLTEKDAQSHEAFHDTIAMFADNDLSTPAKQPVCVPYRCLVPREVEGLLVACRAFSSTDSINNRFNLVPHCICLGQAAGTAAALAIQNGTSVRKVDSGALRSRLVAQGVLLP